MQCEKIHKLFNSLNRFSFPFDESKIPKNGIYILFEKGEKGHNCDRIVRVGTHIGKDKLRSRLKQHFLKERKDLSIFRKNIGRAILNKRKDDFLDKWELCLVSLEDRKKYSDKVDFDKQNRIEKEVSKFIQDNFSFVVFRIDDKDKRLELESKLISTVSNCDKCKCSDTWLGLFSPKEKIRKSGLWLVNELYKEGLNEKDFEELEILSKHSPS